MNIIVCAKQVRHTYARTGTSPDSHYINDEDGIYRVNPHDEAALELALRLKDQHKGITIILLTLGPVIAENEVQRCLATGADRWVQIDVDESLANGGDPLDQPDPWVKSTLLALAIGRLKGDLVLCGKASIDKANGQVGALLAHRLERPFVSAITDLSLDVTKGILKVQRSAGRGVREILECRAPAVFSVELGVDLRLPELPRRQWADAYVPERFEYKAADTAPRVVCGKRFQPRPRPRIVPVPDSSHKAYDRVMQLLTGSTVEKKGEMLTGSSESQVEGILTFLKGQGFLESDHADQ